MKSKFTSNFLINILIGGIVIFFILTAVFTLAPRWFVSSKANETVNAETDSVSSIMKTVGIHHELKPIDQLISDSIPYFKYQRLEDSIHTLRKLRNGDAMALSSSATLNPIATFTGSYCTTCRIRYDPNSTPHFFTLNKPVQNYILLLDWKIKQSPNKWYGDSSQYYVDDKGQSYLRKRMTNKKHSSYPVDIPVPFRYNAKYNCLMIPVQASTKQTVQIILITTALLFFLYALFFIIGGFIKFLLDISRGETFTLMNVRRLKIIAFSLIVYPILIFLVDLSLPLIFHSYFTGDVTLSISNWPELCIILFMGLVFLLLYKAFRTGKQIKEEQDLTV